MNQREITCVEKIEGAYSKLNSCRGVMWRDQNGGNALGKQELAKFVTCRVVTRTKETDGTWEVELDGIRYKKKRRAG